MLVKIILIRLSKHDIFLTLFIEITTFVATLLPFGTYYICDNVYLCGFNKCVGKFSLPVCRQVARAKHLSIIHIDLSIVLGVTTRFPGLHNKPHDK